jgi:hypothetical protein
MKSDPLWALDKEFKANQWFKRNLGLIINTIENILIDLSFSSTTIRVAILLLANLSTLFKQTNPVPLKAFIRNNQTIERFS